MRTKLIHVDIMVDGDSKYYATMHIRKDMHFDFKRGEWGVEFEEGELSKRIESRYPTLNGRDYNIHLY